MSDIDALRTKEDALYSGHNYEEFHRIRYEYLLNKVQKHAPAAHLVLDIGRSPFTDKLRQLYSNIWTLGFPEAAQTPNHIEFDLNDIAVGARAPCNQKFDLIVFSEVIEHLHIPAYAVLGALQDLMAEGGVMILQTPNAAEVMKRVALLRGLNPYEPLRLNPRNPGHFREYTMKELVDAAQTAGLSVREAHYIDYFPRESVPGFHPVRTALDVCRRFIPAFRSGQTLVLERT